MQQFRGILCLNEASFRAAQKHTDCVQRLIFNENEPLLYQAQAALWQMRRHFSWICIAAEGREIWTALALAAQLPVDRLALRGAWMHPLREEREHMRLRKYALNNLPLVISDVMLSGAREEEIRAIVHRRRHGRTCVLLMNDWEGCAALLSAPWPDDGKKTCQFK